MGTHPIFESDFDCLTAKMTEMQRLDDAVNKQVVTMRKLSELRHKVPVKLKSEWLDRENTLIDQELSQIRKETRGGIFDEINAKLQDQSNNCSFQVQPIDDANASATDNKSNKEKIKEIFECHKREEYGDQIDGVPTWLIETVNKKS